MGLDYVAMVSKARANVKHRANIRGERQMNLKDLSDLYNEVYDININPDPNTLTMAVLKLRSALEEVIQHLIAKEGKDES